MASTNPPAPAGYRYDKSGKLVANLGNDAPGYVNPTAAQKSTKPTSAAGPNLHWEWNGAKWVSVPNKDAPAPSTATTQTLPTTSATISMPSGTVETTVPWQITASELYGWIAELYNYIPELQSIIDTAKKEKWNGDRFDNAIKSTSWWRSTDAAERAYRAKQISDPTTLANDIKAKQFQIETYIGGLGYSLNATLAKSLAEQSIRYGWGAEEEARYVGAELAKTGKSGSQQGASAVSGGLDAASIRQFAQDYGIKLDDETINSYAQNLISKTMTAEQIKQTLRQDAENLYPALKGQLQTGRTVGQATSTYRQLAANSLNIDPYTIDFTDNSKWGKLLSYRDPNSGEARLMNGTEWSTFIRTLPEWQQTDEAKTLYRDVSSTILRGFGALI